MTTINKMYGNKEINLASFEDRIKDFLKVSNQLYGNNFATPKNPHNVKYITKMILDENKSQFMRVIYEDLIDRCEEAIKNNKYLQPKDVFPIGDFMDDKNIRFEIFEDLLAKNKDEKISNKNIQSIIAYAPNKIADKVVVDYDFNLMLPVGNINIPLISYVARKKLHKTLVNKINEISPDEMRVFLDNEKLNKTKLINNLMVNMFSVIYKCHDAMTEFVKKFSTILHDDEILYILENRSKDLIKSINKVNIKFKKEGKFSANDFSVKQYDFFKALDIYIPKEKYLRLMNIKDNNTINFLKTIRECPIINDKFNNLEKKTKNIKLK